MFAAIRRGDFVISTCQFKSSGPFITASTNKFVNGRGQVRVGDRSIPGMAITGSHSVFIDGKPAVILPSKVICGRIKGPGSTNTFIGG
jgi:uncharacterized Zn-binding protein involved in type VI secretion